MNKAGHCRIFRASPLGFARQYEFERSGGFCFVSEMDWRQGWFRMQMLNCDSALSAIVRHAEGAPHSSCRSPGGISAMLATIRLYPDARHILWVDQRFVAPLKESLSKMLCAVRFETAA